MHNAALPICISLSDLSAIFEAQGKCKTKRKQSYYAVLNANHQSINFLFSMLLSDVTYLPFVKCIDLFADYASLSSYDSDISSYHTAPEFEDGTTRPIFRKRPKKTVCQGRQASFHRQSGGCYSLLFLQASVKVDTCHSLFLFTFLCPSICGDQRHYSEVAGRTNFTFNNNQYLVLAMLLQESNGQCSCLIQDISS